MEGSMKQSLSFTKNEIMANCYEQVLASAKNEFFLYGYRQTRLKSIANGNGVSLNYIQKQFKTKKQLFERVLEPLIGELEGRHDICSDDVFEGVSHKYGALYECSVRFLLEMYNKYPEEMYILFCGADGSSYENYKESFIKKGSDFCSKFFTKLDKGISISDFFINKQVAFIINSVTEAVRLKKSRQEICYYEEELVSFLRGAWSGVIEC